MSVVSKSVMSKIGTLLQKAYVQASPIIRLRNLHIFILQENRETLEDVFIKDINRYVSTKSCIALIECVYILQVQWVLV